MAIDQAREQNNTMIKGFGAAVGLTENLIAFRKWMNAGSGQARLMEEIVMQPGETLPPRGCLFFTEKPFKQQVLTLLHTIEE